LLRKNDKYKWNFEHQQSFDFQKKKIINAPILKYPSFNEKFIIIKDVSYECIAEVLPIVLLTWKKQHLYIILQN